MSNNTQIKIRGNPYTIEFRIWKEEKYGEPDIVECHGEYLTEKAAQIDMEFIDSTFWYVGFARTTTKIVERQTTHETQ